MARVITCIALCCVMSALWPVYRFCRSAWCTSLRSTAAWVAIATAGWLVESIWSALEPAPGMWAWLGLIRLAVCALLLAPVVAILGARRPGELLWNFIVVSLLLVLSLPILEQSLLGKELASGRFGLDAPRAILFATITAVGALNYLLTRFAIAAVLFGTGAGIALIAVGPWPVEPARVAMRFAAAGILFSLAAWSAYCLRPRLSVQGIESGWYRLRDQWGFVWSARVRDRWNAAARQHGWNLRLDWDGLHGDRPDRVVMPESRLEAEAYLRRLLRRFFDPGV